MSYIIFSKKDKPFDYLEIFIKALEIWRVFKKLFARKKDFRELLNIPELRVKDIPAKLFKSSDEGLHWPGDQSRKKPPT